MSTPISQRASAGLKRPAHFAEHFAAEPMPTNMPDRDILREKWRLLAIKFAEADDKAIRAKEGKQIFLDDLINTLLEQAEAAGEKLAQAKAERIARTSEAYKNCLKEMHDLRHAAKLAEIEEKNADRLYWQQVSDEATQRKEMSMSR
jgi:hypothetical protein